MVGLLKRLQPRGFVVFGCAILALAGMSGLLAWLDTIPPRDQLLQITGELRELVLQDESAGAFKITVASGGALHSFEFEDARRLVDLLSPGANLEVAVR